MRLRSYCTKSINTESLPRMWKSSGHPALPVNGCAVTRVTRSWFSPCCFPWPPSRPGSRGPGWGPGICTVILMAQAKVEHWPTPQHSASHMQPGPPRHPSPHSLAPHTATFTSPPAKLPYSCSKAGSEVPAPQSLSHRPLRG